MSLSDPVCDRRGIPPHLHKLERVVVKNFAEGELLYRWFNKEDKKDDLTGYVSFNKKNSSFSRSQFCTEPSDVLWCTENEAGGRRKAGILSIPANALDGCHFCTEEHPDIKWRVAVNHDPTQCNYPHSDLSFFKGDQEKDVIKPGSIKLMIRDVLREKIRELPEILANNPSDTFAE